MDLSDFADDVGPAEAGAVTCIGGRTQWDVGGSVDPSAREVRAPAGVVEFLPAEMIVRCGAGTPLEQLQEEVAAGGMIVPIEGPPGATVGGVLAVGRSGLRALGWGAVRDAVLEIRSVSAEGRIVKAGGPVVKNVSGYDLCRLFVGSLGTLALFGEVVLRCRPRPPCSVWVAADAVDPATAIGPLHGPASVLWDGTTTWVLLEGHADDVRAQRDVLGAAFTEVGGPPPLPAGRASMPPGALRGLPGRFVAQIGVGIVHTDEAPALPPLEPGVVELHQRLKARFDPTNRLSPGRMVW